LHRGRARHRAGHPGQPPPDGHRRGPGAEPDRRAPPVNAAGTATAVGTATGLVRPGSAGLVRVRRATTADREPLRRMFERCSPDTRYRRFHAPVKAIPARYLTEALSGSAFHYALVAWHQDPGQAKPTAPAPGQPEADASGPTAGGPP